jgi:hypothetical protein
MGRQRSNVDAYTGRGGQMGVLAEVLLRQVNVAVPEVDEGEDVFAFLSGEPQVTRMQVKTANAEPLKEQGRYAARVSVPLAQLEAEERARLHYVFAVRLGDRWADFVIISRADLLRLSKSVGYVNTRAGELQLHLSFGPGTLVCSGRDFQPYRNAWQLLPVFDPASRQAAPASASEPPTARPSASP